jgi:hypothetical protein
MQPTRVKIFTFVKNINNIVFVKTFFCYTVAEMPRQEMGFKKSFACPDRHRSCIMLIGAVWDDHTMLNFRIEFENDFARTEGYGAQG